MIEATSWQEANGVFLTAALAWLRSRLNQLASGDPLDQTEDRQTLKAMRWAGAVDPPPALEILSRRLGLTPFEQEILLLCAALELDTGIPGLCAAAQAEIARPYPTFALAMACFDDPAWEALSPERPLRYWHLVEINQPGAEPLTTSALRADERIVNFIKGLSHLDDRLAPYLFALEEDPSSLELPPSQAAAAEVIAAQLETSLASRRPEIVQLIGPDGGSKRAVAREIAGRLGLVLYRLPAELLPAHTTDIETLARLWQRESVLMPVALYVDALESNGSNSGEYGVSGTSPLRRFLARLDGLLFLDTRQVRPSLGRSSLTYDIERPTADEQRLAWERFAPEGVPEQLAAQFNLNLAMIERIGTGVGQGGAQDLGAYWEACLVRTWPELDLLAQRLTPKATWQDIVLPSDQNQLLREIAAQVRQRDRVYNSWGYRKKMNRGLGISALFAGESGTGKTMAAEVIANELHLDLFRIDLSAVASKYIGETEKNLRKLFDAAEDGGSILFFDEADALFGKRSEVRDSHDRYANIEINYLLQRMEAYRGLAILATNRKSALDPAFMRRLRFVVDFPFPGHEARRAIWDGVFPAETPVASLDTERLARLSLAGGSIHNIALAASFLAASNGREVSMPLVLSAARTEYRKLERTVDERDFLWPLGA